MFDAGGDNWDLLADDLFFTPDYRGDVVLDKLLPDTVGLPSSLDLDAFLAGNIPRKNRHRRELGFLKPVMRRSFLTTHGLRYDERLRLGEDLVLYAHALLKGGRFRLVEGCGYYAVERPNSLSGLHRTQDIAELYRALRELETAVARSGKDVPSLGKLVRATRNNRDFRVLLDAKRERGLEGAITAIANAPASIPYIALAVLDAKWGAALKRLNATATRPDAVRIKPQAIVEKAPAERKPTR